MVVHARQGFDDPNEAERKMKKAQHAQLLAMQVSEREGDLQPETATGG